MRVELFLQPLSLGMSVCGHETPEQICKAYVLALQQGRPAPHTQGHRHPQHTPQTPPPLAPPDHLRFP